MEFICVLANLCIPNCVDDLDGKSAVGTVKQYLDVDRDFIEKPDYRFYILEKSNGNYDLLKKKLLETCSSASAYIISEFFRYYHEQKDITEFVEDINMAVSFLSSYEPHIYDTEYLLDGHAKTIAKYTSLFGTEFKSKAINVDGFPHMVYFTNSYQQIFMFDLLTALTNLASGYFFPKVRKCLNCGRYFLAGARSDVKYCSYPAPQNRIYTCADPQIRIMYGKTATETEIKAAYRRINAALTARVNRHPDNDTHAYSLNEFKKETEIRKEKLAKGRMTEEEYLKFLNEYCY